MKKFRHKWTVKKVQDTVTSRNIRKSFFCSYFISGVFSFIIFRIELNIQNTTIWIIILLKNCTYIVNIVIRILSIIKNYCIFFVFLTIIELMYELILKNIFISDIKSATYIYIRNGITQFNYIYYNVNAAVVIISMAMETS